MKRIRIVRTLITLVSLGALMFAPLLRLNAFDLTNLGPPSNFDQRIKPYSRQPSKEALRWTDKQLKRMSLDEKIGQLICAAVNATVADVNNNAANPVINVRSYGEDPTDVARFVAAFVAGAQRGGVFATAKHFPGHGDTATDSHRGLPEIDVTRERLNSVELVPFRAAVSAGVGAVMDGHIGLPQIDSTVISPLPRDVKLKPIDTDENGEIINAKGTMPTTLSPVMNGILRNDLHFDGLIVTDAMSMSGLTLYFTQEEASVRALEAGADLLLKPADPDASMRGMRDAVKSGRLTEPRIEQSARKVLAAKYDLGLVRQRLTPLDEIDRIVAGRQAVALSEEIAEHAVTLVRNDAKLIPIEITPAKRVFNLAITNGDDRLWIAQAFVGTM